jgi:hypothetical protein
VEVRSFTVVLAILLLQAGTVYAQVPENTEDRCKLGCQESHRIAPCDAPGQKPPTACKAEQLVKQERLRGCLDKCAYEAKPKIWWHFWLWH